MENHYKSALDKIQLKDSQKNKAKALFYEAERERNKKMGVKSIFKRAAAVAASLAIIVAAGAGIPKLQHNNKEITGGAIMPTDNHFSVTAYAQELTKTGKVYPNNYASLGYAICGSENYKDNISFAFDFPIECKGKNIDTITYAIKNGAFQISNPKGKSVVIDGEKPKQSLNVPGSSKEDIENDSEEAFQWEQYKSFTVKYDNQINDKTCIDVVDTSDSWDQKKLNAYQKLDHITDTSSRTQEKNTIDFLTEDLGITCTVTYKDGSKETKKIKVSSEIKKLSEVTKEKLTKKEGDTEFVVKYFSIQ